MAQEAKVSTDKVTDPRGQQFDVVGRAGPIRVKAAPSISAEAGGDLLTIKEGRVFVCSSRNGDIHPGLATGEGLYADDSRYLSELLLKIGGTTPVLLSSSAGFGYEAFVELTNATLRHVIHESDAIPQMTLIVRRTRLTAERVYERIEVRNHGARLAETDLELSFAADFADIFEVRGMRKRMSRGQALRPKRNGRGLSFAYVGEDELFRETIIDLRPDPAELDLSEEGGRATWALRLEPGEALRIEVTVEPSLGGERKRRRSFETAVTKVQESSQQWRASCTQIGSPHRSFNRFIDASLRDLNALRTPSDGSDVITAGIPWYVAPFGRDSLITCYETLMLKPSLARDALLFLARHQAQADDPLRDAEPGKILHELRVGELARAGYIPFNPYYGTADATPLFLMLAGAYYRWTADLETMVQLRPAFDAALKWIDEHGDADGDGFVEYLRRSPGGLVNQGWKDSAGAVVHADGSRAEGPIALVEVQGYVYLAKERIAEVYEALGAGDRARALRWEAAGLKGAFNSAFWMPEEQSFALALDGDKRQVKSVTSNPGHSLYCAIADAEKGTAVAERLMAPDMFSGWGIRTLSTQSPAYNPVSYHNGSVWPHDNAIIAAGLKRYGFKDATQSIATALFEAATESPDSRLPELYCGFERRAHVPFVAYPVACRPQAWAAAVPFMLLQSMLGISARAPEGLLTVNKPELPSWLSRLEVKNIQIADSRVSLAFTRDGGVTSVSLLAREGDIRVMIEE